MFFNCCRLEERLAQRKAKLAEMKKSQEEELSKNDPDKQESLMKEQVDRPNFLFYQGGGSYIFGVLFKKPVYTRTTPSKTNFVKVNLLSSNSKQVNKHSFQTDIALFLFQNKAYEEEIKKLENEHDKALEDLRRL